MYHEFYQFRENPFNVTADPEFFFSSKSHTEAFFSLIYGINQRKGILVITGEIGTGKTTICRKLLNDFDDKTKFALVFNPKFSELQLLHMIANDFNIALKSKNKFAIVQTINDFLIAESRKGNNVVIVIDEAQNLTTSQLEQIRLLSNLETDKEKLLQIVLVGQPELHQKLQSPKLRQLRQRVAVYFHLHPLEKLDIKSYIDHRISKALRPAARQITFSDSALDSIFQYSAGSPRTINMLCDRALLAGFVAETFSIDDIIIKNSAKEVLYCEHYI